MERRASWGVVSVDGWLDSVLLGEVRPLGSRVAVDSNNNYGRILWGHRLAIDWKELQERELKTSR